MTEKAQGNYNFIYDPQGVVYDGTLTTRRRGSAPNCGRPAAAAGRARAIGVIVKRKIANLIG